jgi:hypothetical protein
MARRPAEFSPGHSLSHGSRLTPCSRADHRRKLADLALQRVDAALERPRVSGTNYCIRASTARPCVRIGMSASASFQGLRKSSYAARVFARGKPAG